MMTLAAHIAALNAKTQAWVNEAAPGVRWASGLTEDLAHWAEYGITTPEQLDHYLLVSDVFEMTRCIWDYKPSWSGLMALSNAHLEAELESMRAEAKRREEEEKAAAAREASFIRMECQNTGFPIADILPSLQS